jgi:hypothetical protein
MGSLYKQRYKVKGSTLTRESRTWSIEFISIYDNLGLQ